MVISDNLKYLRGYLKISQKEMSAYVGVNRTTYQAYEDERNNIPIHVLSNIADFFGIPMETLLKIKIVGIGIAAEGNLPYVKYIFENKDEIYQRTPIRLLEHLKTNGDDIRKYHDRMLRSAIKKAEDMNKTLNDTKNNVTSVTNHDITSEHSSPIDDVHSLKLRLEMLEEENQKLTEENFDWRKRYIGANRDFFEATNETIELSTQNKNIAQGIKEFYALLQEQKFRDEDDKAQVIRLYEDIVLSTLSLKNNSSAIAGRKPTSSQERVKNE